MRPRTKLQFRIVDLSKKLPILTKKQEQWSFFNSLNHIAYRTKKGISCLDCGHSWPGNPTIKACRCPQCKTKLIIEDSMKKKYSQYATVGLVSVVKEFQVNRFFEIWSYHRVGQEPRQYITEMVQQWFTPEGKLTVIAKTSSFGRFCASSDLEIKPHIENYWNSNKYDLYVDKILPGAKCLPIYKRNGFTSRIGNVPLYSFFTNILHDTIAETLVKAQQYGLLSARLGSRSYVVKEFWDSIKICMRNKYKINDSVSYLDYLQLLKQNGNDLKSPIYVCPSNFKRAHDVLVEKRTKQQNIRRAEQERINAEQRIIAAEKRKLTDEQDKIRYLHEKAQYFGLKFTSGKITIKVLESVEAFKSETDVLNHCVYTNKYYNMEDALCFSAAVDGVQTETIEVSISRLQVVQSRGKGNSASPYNKEIVDLVNKNMFLIHKRRDQHKMEAA